MSSLPTGEEVWKKLLENVPQVRGNVGFCTALRPFVDAVPNIFQDELTKPVTIESVAQARLKFLEHQMREGYARKTIAQMPPQSFNWFSQDTLTLWLVKDMQAERDMLKGMLIDIPMYLLLERVTERQVLNALFGEGVPRPATIADLLLSKPELVVFDNFSNLFSRLFI